MTARLPDTNNNAAAESLIPVFFQLELPPAMVFKSRSRTLTLAAAVAPLDLKLWRH